MANFSDVFGGEAAASTPEESFSSVPVPPELQDAIRRSALNNRVDPDLHSRVLYQESRFRPDIIEGKTRSRVGAVGIGQVMEKYHPNYKFGTGVENDIEYSSKVLAEYTNMFEGDSRKGVAAYNWGPGNVKKAIERYGENWLDYAPDETKNYVANIMGPGSQSQPRRALSPTQQTAQNMFGGERKPYDPIRPRASALPTGGAPESQFMSVFGMQTEAPPPAEDEDGTFSSAFDKAKGLTAGVLDAGGALIGAGEYAARNTQNPNLASALGTGRKFLTGMAESIDETLNPEARAQMQREVLTLDPNRTLWQGNPAEVADALAMKAVRSGASQAVTAGIGALMFRAGFKNGAIAFLGASEATMSVGAIANNVAQEIEAAPEEQLLQNPMYAELRQEMDEAAARQEFTTRAQGMAPAIGGFVAGLIGAQAGRYLQPKFADSTTRLGAAAATAAANVPEEYAQEAAEQVAQNVAAQVYDSDRRITEGVAESGSQGALLGGIQGGVIGGVVGPRRQTALPTPASENPPMSEADPQAAPAGPPPASFESVFGTGGQQTATLDDIAPDPTAGSFLTQRRMTDLRQGNLREARQIDAERSSLQVSQDSVDPAVAVALAIRSDRKMGDMFGDTQPPAEPTPSPDFPRGEDPMEMWRRNDALDLQGGGPRPPAPPPPGTAMTPEPYQPPLGLREPDRQRGQAPSVIYPTQAAPAQPDMTPPPGYEGAPPVSQGLASPAETGSPAVSARRGRINRRTGRERPFVRDLPPQADPNAPAPTFRNDDQIDMFDQRVDPPVSIDEPSAEPVRDLLAQLDDLKDPDSGRQGVYLSRANITNLRQNGALERMRGDGVPLANFDGKGGTMIAKNRQVADELLEMRRQGIEMQAILGYATRAGEGKPAVGEVAVQQRDRAGNVTRETAVATEEEADAISAQWEREDPTRKTFITSAGQAIRRRAIRIGEENRVLEQEGESRRVRRRASEIVERDLADDQRLNERARRLVNTAESDEQAARRLTSLGSSYRRDERRKTSQGIPAPEVLEFPEPVEGELPGETTIDAAKRIRRERKQAKQYRAEYEEAYNDLLGGQTLKNTATTDEERKAADERIDTASKKLAAIRTVGKPTMKSERIIRAARRINNDEVEKMRRAAARRASKRGSDTVDYLMDPGELTPMEIEELSGSDLTAAFAAAAKYTAGRSRSAKRGEYVWAIPAMKEQFTKLQKETAAAKTEKMRATAALKALGKKATAEKRAEVEKRHFEATQAHKKLARRLKTFRKDNSTYVADAREGGPLTLDDIIKRYGKNDATKKKLVARVQDSILSRKYGPASKRWRKRAGTALDSEVMAQKTNFNLDVLTVEKRDREISKANRRIVAQRAEKAFVGLTSSMKNLSALIDKTSKGKFAELLAVRNETSVLPGSGKDNARAQLGRDLLIARAYLVTMLEYGSGLEMANNRSSVQPISEVERFNATVAKLAEMNPEQLAKAGSKLFRIEETQSLRKAAKSDKIRLSFVVYPDKRKEITDETNAKNAAQIARIAQIQQYWSTNTYYRNQVAPLIDKITSSIVTRGVVDYVPTMRELRSLQFAMRLWKRNPDTAKNLYSPLKALFKRMGYDIEDAKLTKDYQFGLTDERIEKNSKRKQDGDEQDLGSPPSTISDEQLYAQYASNIARYREKLGQDEILTQPQIMKLAEMRAYNAAVQKLQGDLSKLPASELIEIENQVMAALIGMQRVRRVGMMENIWVPNLRRDKQVTYRQVGPRLIEGKLNRTDAERILKGTFKPVGISEETRANKDVSKIMTAENRGIRSIVKNDAKVRETLRRGEMTLEQRKAAEALDRQNLAIERERQGKGLELMTGVTGDAVNDAARRTATAMSNVLETRESNGREMLEIAIAALPEGSRYRAIMQRLLQVPGMDQVRVFYTDRPMGNRAGTYVETERDGKPVRFVKISRPKLNEIRAAGRDPHFALIHIMTHELVHAATLGALKNNNALGTTMWALMRRVSAEARTRGMTDSKWYALRDQDVTEFVAEAFSNTEFQNFLKSIPIEPKLSIWQGFLNLVKRIIGVENAEFDNVLDLVMATTDAAFTGELVGRTAGSDIVAGMEFDEFTTGFARNAFDKIAQSARFNQNLRSRAKEALETRFLPVMTMEQIRNGYSEYFQKGRANGLAEYMSGFFKRNAANTEALEAGDKLSRQWTAVEEKHPAAAVAMSRLMTDATMFRAHPELSINDPANAHLTRPEERLKHAELAQQWSKLPEEVQDLYEDVQTFYDTTLRKEVNLMTLNALRGFMTKGDDMLTDEEFKYTERDVEELRLDTVEGIRDEFGAFFEGKDGERQMRTLARMASLPKRRVGPYFPLMRFGDFVVYAERERERKRFPDRKAARAFVDDLRADDPMVDTKMREVAGGVEVTVSDKEFRMAETRSEAAAFRADMVAKYGEQAVTPVQLKSDFYRTSAAISSNSALGTIMNKLQGNAAAQAAIKDFYLRSIADSSFRKREMTRKNRAGVDPTVQHRTFANYAKSSSYYTAQLRFGWFMARARQDMEKAVRDHRDESDITAVQMGQVVREIKARDEMTTSLQEPSKLVRAGTELGHFMLLTSPSYWMINLTQPYTVTLPWLAARSSMGDATTALANAQKLIMHPLVTQGVSTIGGLKLLLKNSRTDAEKAFGVYEQVEATIAKNGGDRAADYVRMLKDLKRESIIDLSFVAELREIADGEKNLAQRVLDAGRIMGHLTEVNNRIMTALASYDIARSKGGNHDNAVQFAKDAVSQTQFNYSAGNKPRLFQQGGPLGRAGPLVFQFMQYPQHMYALLITNFRAAFGDSPEAARVGRRTLLGVLGTHMLAGGAVGMLLQPIKWAIGLAAFAFGDDDEPFDFDTELTKVLVELTTPEIGRTLALGVPAEWLGTDLSQRMSLGTLYMANVSTESVDNFWGSMLTSFGGPVFGIAGNMVRGTGYLKDGDWAKAFEAGTPKLLKDLSKTVRYTNEGLTDASGKVLLPANEMSPAQLFLQSIGLTPSQVSARYARNEAVKNADQFDFRRKTRLLKQFRRAKTNEERAQVALEIAEFSKNNPEQAITRSDLIRSVVGAREAEQRLQQFGTAGSGGRRLYSDRGEVYEQEDDDEADLDDPLDLE